MKLWPVISILALAAMIARADDIKPGDSYGQVIAALGVPQGEISSGDFRLLDYERGKVELRSGKVSKLDLIPAEIFAEKKKLREKRVAEAELAASEARGRRIAEGTAIRKSKLADAAFMSSPAGERVAFWQGFKKLYPEIPPGDEYISALKELELQYAAERADAARQQRIDNLEQRVSAAEQRAQYAGSGGIPLVYDSPVYYGFDYRGMQALGAVAPHRHESTHRTSPFLPVPYGYTSRDMGPRASRPDDASPFQAESVSPHYLVTPFSGGGFSFSFGGR